MRLLTVTGLSHRFERSGVSSLSEPIQAIGNLDLHLEAGEFVSIVGPSGCGKSTLLKILAELIEPSEGHISCSRTAGSLREVVSYMPQTDSLLPWLRVRQNALLGARIAGVDVQNTEREFDRLTDQFGLRGFENAWPAQLSGGMRQRLALMRTFLMPREIMLFDEPFGSLDAITRREMHHWLQSVWTETNRSGLLVTHDVEEALFLSDRVYVMTGRPGRMHDEIDVNFVRPRTVQLSTDPQFVTMKSRLLESLEVGMTSD